jgi:hypothetical protein
VIFRQWFPWHTVFAINPTSQVNELASFRTKRAKRIFFPLDWLTAGGTLHQSLTGSDALP